MAHNVYVYGTLMEPEKDRPKFRVPGVIYDLGSYPGAKLTVGHNSAEPPTFVAEKITDVSEQQLLGFDFYEGFNPDEPDSPHNLYLRKPFLDGWIYEYNHPVDGARMIESGDWQAHTNGGGHRYASLL